jgi:hypothetical protein
VTGSRHQHLHLYVRFGVGIVLMCALVARIGLVSPLRIVSNETTFKSDHFPLKPRLLDPRGVDWNIPGREFSSLDSPEPVLLISHSPIEATTFHTLGPYSNRPPPQN